MREIAEILLKIRAVSLSPSEPFTWASGIISPIYCDNRLLLSYRKEWGVVIEAMREVVEKEFPDAEYIMGTAAAGIPHASVLAYLMEKPSGFVRGKAKDHGRKNQIEGKIHEGMKVVVIEDLISTGGSSIEVVEALREAGCDVLGMVSIFTYGMEKANRAMKEKEVKLHALTTYSELLDTALTMDYITEKDREKLKVFMKNPQDEGWRTL
jgi:orotate phosphoribosyltransferase